MFNLLEKKSYILIGGFLLVSMSVAFIIFYCTYSSLLKRDFLNKQEYLATQTVRTFEEFLMFLDEQTDLFINKNQLYKELENKNKTSMGNFHFENIDFVRLDIFSTDELFASIEYTSSFFSAASPSVSEIKSIIGEKDSTWYIYDINENAKQALIYIKPIKLQNNVLGYLAAWINKDSINRILSLDINNYTTSEKKMFSEYTSAAIRSSDKLYICRESPSANIFDQIIKSDSEQYYNKIHGDFYLFCFDIGLQDMSVFLEGDITLLKNYLSLMRKKLVIIYVIITSLIIGLLYLFYFQISTLLRNLYNKIVFK